jgi:pre-mRNA-processing factor 6
LQWESIPDIGDYTVKKQKHLDRFTPVPDSLLAGAAARDATATAIDASGLATPMGGITTDLTAMGAGRNTVVQLKLDKISDSVSGQTVVDPKGYLTDLKSVTLKSGAVCGLCVCAWLACCDGSWGLEVMGGREGGLAPV